MPGDLSDEIVRTEPNLSRCSSWRTHRNRSTHTAHPGASRGPEIIEHTGLLIRSRSLHGRAQFPLGPGVRRDDGSIEGDAT